MQTEVVEKDFPHDRVLIRTQIGIALIFGHDERGSIRSFGQIPQRGYVAKKYFLEARELAKQTFEEAATPK